MAPSDLHGRDPVHSPHWETAELESWVTYWIPFPTLASMGHPFFWVRVGNGERLQWAHFLDGCVVKSRPTPRTYTRAVMGTN